MPDPRLIAFFTALLLLVLNACASNPPARPDNLCEIFDEKSSWYKHARAAERQWGMPVPVGMAFIHKESSYRSDARPDRERLLWVIPWKRPSSAFGYAQATNEAWSDYMSATGGGWLTTRDDMRDALDFVGWYNDRSHRKLGIPMTDAYHLYIAYYVGPTGYAKGGWRNDGRVKGYARRVAERAAHYEAQLKRCAAELEKPWYRL
jgi:hypothetical protein